MIKLMLLAIVLTGTGGGQVQMQPRAERKKPLSEAVEKVLADFVRTCVPEKKKQLRAQMEDVVKTLDATVKLTPEEKRAVEEASQKAIEETLKTWQPLAQVMMRTYLSRTSDAAAIRHIGLWKPELAGPNEPIEGWIPPDEDPAWLAALKAILGDERYTTWHAADARAKEQTEKDISSHLERWVRESRGLMNEDLRAKIELMKQKLELSEPQVTALNKTAESLLDRISDAEKKRATGMLRTLPAEARESLMGRSYFYIAFDRPLGEAWDQMWDEAAVQVLPAETMARWHKTDQEQRSKAEIEAADLIRPSEQQAEQQMEMAMTAEIDGMVLALNLDKKRREALEKLSKEAILEALKLARKGWLQQAKNYSTTDRKRIRGNVYFGMNDEQMANKQPIWTEGVKKVLTENERARLAEETQQREQRGTLALARACLAEMDKMLVLSQDQRQQLEPLVMEVIRPLMEQRRQQYWSYNATQLFQSAGKVKEEKVRGILDAVQWKHWKELTGSSNPSSRYSLPDMNGNFPEVPDIEAAISQHLYKMFVAERSRVLAAMMPQVEEAARVLALPEREVARLTTAAKGAVENSLESWRQFTENFVRQSVQTATRKNALQALAGTERTNFSRNETPPEDTELWKTALKATLNEAQQKKLREVTDERRRYRLRAIAAVSASEADRRRKLSAEQCDKLENALQKAMEPYLPDMERYMSAQWFLQYYYVLVPLAGVPEKELEEILTPEQWKLCKERDLADVMQYWEGIKTNHDRRMKQEARANGNALLDE